MEYVQSVNVPLQVSFDNGVTWKDVVCLVNYNDNLAVPTNDTDTFCGRLTGTGNPALDFTGECVHDIEPLSTQVSWDELSDALLAGTTFKARKVYPKSGSVGSIIYLQSDAIVESIGGKQTSNDYVKFDFSIKGQGIPTKTQA